MECYSGHIWETTGRWRGKVGDSRGHTWTNGETIGRQLRDHICKTSGRQLRTSRRQHLKNNLETTGIKSADKWKKFGDIGKTNSVRQLGNNAGTESWPGKQLRENWETTSGRQLENHCCEASGRQLDNSGETLEVTNWEATSGKPHREDIWETTGWQIEEIRRPLGASGKQFRKYWKTSHAWDPWLGKLKFANAGFGSSRGGAPWTTPVHALTRRFDQAWTGNYYYIYILSTMIVVVHKCTNLKWGRWRWCHFLNTIPVT